AHPGGGGEQRGRDPELARGSTQQARKAPPEEAQDLGGGQARGAVEARVPPHHQIVEITVEVLPPAARADRGQVVTQAPEELRERDRFVAAQADGARVGTREQRLELTPGRAPLRDEGRAPHVRDGKVRWSRSRKRSGRRRRSSPW